MAILLIFTLFCVIFADASYYMKKDHSLVKPYADDHWEFVGTTIVTNNYVRLTADVRSLQGSIWNTVPCQLTDWELHIHFKVHGKGRDLFGDGFAIWYTGKKMELGPVFGSRDFFTGLGIFLDTYANQNGQHNHGHPYISAMVNDGSQHYDHDLDGTITALSGCDANIRDQPHDTYIAVRYEHNKLTVSTDLDGKNTWKNCFTVDGVHLPTGYFFGVSAATGDLSDNHDIISLKLYDIGVERKETGDTIDSHRITPSADSTAPPRRRADDKKIPTKSSTAWKTVALIVFVVVAISMCAFIGYTVYNRTQYSSRKRFY